MQYRRVKMKSGDVELTVLLNDSITADLIWDALPLESSVSTWGDEIYFSTLVQTSEENAQAVVSIGDVAYWPPGQAICLFYGPTPNSLGDEIRPASPVNVVGSMEGDPTALKKVIPGSKIVADRV